MITLNHCHESRSMRTLWLLHELDIPFEVKTYPFGKALRTPQYLSIHPLGRVPSIELNGERNGEMDGQVMFETGAIAEYLSERYPEQGLGRMPGDPERAEFLQWLHYAETIGVHGAALTQQHIVIYEDKDRSPLLMKLERRRLEKALEVLDAHFSDGREYLLKSGFSAVDTNVGYSVYISRYFTPLEAMPYVAAYYDRLSSRPAFRKSLPAEPAIYTKPFYELPEVANP